MNLLTLLGLALVDSLSAGTFVIPLILLVVWQRVKPIHFGVYLGTIALSYFLIGIGLFFGMGWIANSMNRAQETDWFPWVMVTLGVMLAIFGVFSPNPKQKTLEEVLEGRPRKTQKASASPCTMAALALGAAVIETATMLPYLAAIGIIQSSEWKFITKLFVLGAYCLVMIAPAVVAGALFQVFGWRIFDRINKIMPRLEYEAKITILWISAIVGIILVIRSIPQLGIIN